MLKLLKIIIFVTFIVTHFCSLKVYAGRTKQIVEGRYWFIYSEQDSLLINQLVNRLQQNIVSIENFFENKSGSIITIYVTRSEQEYYKYASRTVPEWSQAVAFPGKNLVVLKLISAEEIKKSAQILLHELVHINIAGRLHKKQIPVWLNEGLAQYLSGDLLSFDNKIVLANALLAKKIIRFTDIDSLHNFKAVKARLAYIQSKSAVEFFIRRHGLEKLQHLVQNIARYHSINDAFRETVGYDALDFEIFWYSDLKDHYSWMVILNLDNLLWILMGLLAIVAIVIIRYRNRKKLRLWTETEETDDLYREDI